MEQEKQRQPQENSQKKLLWKPPSGWRYYSPTHRSGWPPTRRQILATIAIVASVSLTMKVIAPILIVYFQRWGLGPGSEPFLIGAIAAVTLIGIGLWKAKLPTRVWKATRGNAALAGVLVALLAAIIGLGGVLYQQHVASDIADKQRQETQVQTYFDDMGDLLLETGQPLRDAEPDDNVSVVAQAKTLTVLEGLDSEHKKSILRFLSNAQLVRKDGPVISLGGAILRGADLSAAFLDGADLSGAILDGADLSRAHGITSEDLEKQSRSLEGATMPDGSTHE